MEVWMVSLISMHMLEISKVLSRERFKHWANLEFNVIFKANTMWIFMLGELKQSVVVVGCSWFFVGVQLQGVTRVNSLSSWLFALLIESDPPVYM